MDFGYCSFFGSTQNRTERTDTELGRFHVFWRTDRYWFSENRTSSKTEEPIGSVELNASALALAGSGRGRYHGRGRGDNQQAAAAWHQQQAAVVGRGGQGEVMVSWSRSRDMDIFRLYSRPNPFREVQICPYSSLDIQHPIPYPYPNMQIAFFYVDTQ